MSTQVIESQSSNAMNEMLADIILDGNIKNLNRDQKKNYVMKVCEVTGLNPALRPFDFITLQGREVMYANKQAAEQLRQIHNISITDVEHKVIDGMIFVTVKGHDGTGRYDSATAALPLPEKKGDAYSNQVMKCETKAKRRFTLSICGLAILEHDDASEMKTSEIVVETGSLDVYYKQMKKIDDKNDLRSWVDQLPKNVRISMRDDVLEYVKQLKKKKEDEKHPVTIEVESEEGASNDND